MARTVRAHWRARSPSSGRRRARSAVERIGRDCSNGICSTRRAAERRSASRGRARRPWLVALDDVGRSTWPSRPSRTSRARARPRWASRRRAGLLPAGEAMSSLAARAVPRRGRPREWQRSSTRRSRDHVTAAAPVPAAPVDPAVPVVPAAPVVPTDAGRRRCAVPVLVPLAAGREGVRIVERARAAGQRKRDQGEAKRP